ncbi:MAG: TetR/AcrR family transcriptional regulator [Xanthobacteraceae bacterium]|nr:MAG: TetR/AcrR family transcriptional regulator [Xanthobacteraceae bacterium]
MNGQPADRVEETVAIALRLFTERGYDNTPMSAVADALGLTKAGVYHHFESKEHLLYLVHKHTLESQLVPLIEQAEAEPDAGMRIRRFMIDYVLLLARDPSAAMLINESRRLAPHHLAEIRGIWRRGYRMLRGTIIELQQRGLCREGVDPVYAAFGAIGMTSWIIHWFDRARGGNADAVARTMCGIFLDGILKDGARP